MRVRTIVIACSVLVTVAACGSGQADTAAVRPTTSGPPTTSSTAAPPTTTTTIAPPTTRKPVPQQVFRADLTVQHAGLGLLALTNTSQRPVTVQGWPTIRFYNAADEPLAVPVKKVDVPGAGPSIAIGPGETAFAGVRWQVGDKASLNTFVATTLRLVPPGGSPAVVVTVIGEDGRPDPAAELDLTAAELGTLQPSSQGVLVF